jgi:tetratricopeptide (TPR) repeat protein
MLFEDCQQPSRARRCLEALLEIEPDNVPAHIEIARLWLREILYHYDLTLTEKMLEVLQRALAIDPDNRDGLFLASLAREMVGGLPQMASPAQTVEGIACVEKILKRDPQDLPARLLLRFT